MQESWIIFRKSVEIVMGNFQQAVRLSGGLFVLAVFLSTAMNVMMTGSMIVNPADIQIDSALAADEQLEAAQKAFQNSSALLVGNLLFFIAMSWIAVAWHRFVLLEESSTQLFPSWNATRLITYLGKTLILVFLIAIGLAVPFAVVSLVVGATGMVGLMPLIGLGLFICVYYLFFRTGLVLPAVALDKRLSFSESFRMTTDLSGAIWGTAMIVVGVSFSVAILLGAMMPNNIFGVLLNAIVQWFMVMISASLLTTIYGHTVERRPLK
jgi:hypothetical protein